MVMMISVSILVIAGGILCLRDADLAWQFYEWDCRMLSLAPPKLTNWQLRVRQVGYLLIGLGILGFIVSLRL